MTDPKDRKTEAGHENVSGPHFDDADLAEIQQAYYGLEAIEPPELLDQAILNAARRELATRRRKPLRWIGAFATATVVVLALTIVIQQDRDLLESDRGNGVTLDKVPEIQALESRKKQDELMNRSAEPQLELQAAPEGVNGPAAPALKAEYEAVPAEAARALPADADMRAEEAPVDPESMERSLDDSMKARAVRDQSTLSTENKADTNQAMGEVMYAPSAAAAARPAADQDEAASSPADPDEWIQRLLLLKQSELFEQLEQELAAFKRAYPDHPLPPDLED